MGAQSGLKSSNSAYTSRKRKVPTPMPNNDGQHDDFEPEDARPKKSKKKVDAGEKRLRRFRAKPPQDFSVIYDRATSQRFYVLERTRAGTAYCPEESVELTGSTGNIYIVLSRVLRARFDLVYQLALLPSELQEIFEHAPPIETEGQSSSEAYDKNRKPLEGDCPICFMPFERDEDTVYCRATCGQNIHKECFEMWAVTKRKSTRDQVTCPMCRTPWQGDDDTVKKIKNKGNIGSDGYVNVADQLGISRERVPTITDPVEV
ncbi:hypothetical protein Daesc_001314 [Daldinia eschscholtzii]|uniref:RING-type domain-containing protein n=1 Tax=Daldinia eschscholtzii TaxID=292717 RepID=A0AAX6MU68_9PEZI